MGKGNNGSVIFQLPLRLSYRIQGAFDILAFIPPLRNNQAGEVLLLRIFPNYLKSIIPPGRVVYTLRFMARKYNQQSPCFPTPVSQEKYWILN